MGKEKYSKSIIIKLPKDEVLKRVKKVLKKLIYPIQYENENTIIAKNENAVFAPAGELIIFDIIVEENANTKLLFFSKDLITVGNNFNRNVKNVDRLIEEFNRSSL